MNYFKFEVQARSRHLGGSLRSGVIQLKEAFLSSGFDSVTSAEATTCGGEERAGSANTAEIQQTLVQGSNGRLHAHTLTEANNEHHCILKTYMMFNLPVTAPKLFLFK